MMVIDNKFNIGQEVYLKTDADQRLRMVTAIIIRPGNSYSYELTWGTDSRWHYDIEITTEKNVLISTTN
jgi:hypothetical protein